MLRMSATGVFLTILCFALSADAQPRVPATKSATAAGQVRPNILFLAVDDLKPTLGCYGNRFIKTPHIDRLAERATVFLNNHCQQAVCAPSRASLMTGKRPDYTKIWDLQTHIRDINPDILTLPQYFRAHGYKTLGIGKVYDARSVDKSQDEPSWSEPYFDVENTYYYNNLPPVFGFYQLPETRAQVAKYIAKAKRSGISSPVSFARKDILPSLECADVPDQAYFDGAMVVKANHILARLAEEGDPFFFAIGFKRPHLPFVAPKKYWDMYKREDIPLAEFQKHSKNGPEIAYHDSHELRSYTDIPPECAFEGQGNRTGLERGTQEELIHAYYAAVTYIDAQIGGLLNTLDSLGLAGNTIIVLWGDHGWHLGDHDLWGKDSNFENATRSPLLIQVPGTPPRQITSPTEFVDVFPTLCDLAELPVPGALDGTSLVPLIENVATSIKEYAVSQFPHRGVFEEKIHTSHFLGNDQRSQQGSMGYSLRTNRYRLTYWMQPGFRSDQHFREDLVYAKEFYDYEKDPLETVNLIEVAAYADAVSKVEKMMGSFFRNQEIK